MKLILDKEEILKVLYYCFCDGGLNELLNSDFDTDYESAMYYKAKENWKKNNPGKSPCLEDVYVQMIREGSLFTFIDYNNDGEKTHLTLELASKNFQTPAALPLLIAMLDENNMTTDCWTGYNLLQYALFGELIYG